MKKYITDFVKVSGFLVCFALISALNTACIRDRDAADVPAAANDAWMLLTVRLPQPSAPLTRADADPESAITAIRILVLEKTDAGYTYSYQAAGYEIEPSGDMQRFRIQLYATDTPLKFMVLVNSEQAFESYTPAAGTPEAALREQLELPFTASGFLRGSLPMYGELTLENGVGTGNTTLQLTAIRSVARVDVVKKLDDGTDDFILEEVHIYRANDKIKPNYDTLPDPAVPVVDTPSVPAGAAFLSAPVSKTEPGGAESITKIYIPESYAAAAEGDKLMNTTVVVIGGRWNGSANVTYYRADFDPDGNFGQVLRNHRYTFNIIRVSAPGWDSPQEAAENPTQSIVVEAQAWEDFSSDIYFGGNSFAISSREIALRFVGDREKRLDVESTLDYRIQWLDQNDQPTGAATSEPGTVISNADIDVSIVRDAGDAARVSHLLFRTRHNNHIGNVITHHLRITVDNWSIDITVRQDNTAVYSSLHFNVLSGYRTFIGGYPAGQLGTTSVLPGTDIFTNGGLAMRKILDVQFAPGGVIRIGGFAFDQIGDGATLLGASATANVEEVNRILRMQNIIYLSYNVLLSVQVAQSIMDWLKGDPHRVLILGLDSGTTNDQLHTLLVNGGITDRWTFTGITGTSYSRAAESAGSTDFFSGPFGQVASNATFGKKDNLLGYTSIPTATSPVTPLITGVNTVGGQSSTVMIFGVDKSRRIIYHGDANLFLSGQLTDNYGSVRSDLDRLMGNIWAWAVEQAIYGDD